MSVVIRRRVMLQQRCIFSPYPQHHLTRPAHSPCPTTRELTVFRSTYSSSLLPMNPHAKSVSISTVQAGVSNATRGAEYYDRAATLSQEKVPTSAWSVHACRVELCFAAQISFCQLPRQILILPLDFSLTDKSRRVKSRGTKSSVQQ